MALPYTQSSPKPLWFRCSPAHSHSLPIVGHPVICWVEKPAASSTIVQTFPEKGPDVGTLFLSRLPPVESFWLRPHRWDLKYSGLWLYWGGSWASHELNPHVLLPAVRRAHYCSEKLEGRGLSCHSLPWGSFWIDGRDHGLTGDGIRV